MNKYNLDITQVLEIVKEFKHYDLAFDLLFDLGYRFVWADYDKNNKKIFDQYLNRKGEQGYIVYCSYDEDKTYAFEYKDSIEKY